MSETPLLVLPLHPGPLPHRPSQKKAQGFRSHIEQTCPFEGKQNNNDIPGKSQILLRQQTEP